MTFTHERIDALAFDLESETEKDGARKYTAPNGEKYPSITTVLSGYNKKAFFDWRERVGPEEANRVSRIASGRGRSLHSVCEKYLLNEMTDMKMRSLMPDAKELFNKIRPAIDENVTKIFSLEQALYSKTHRVAGRCDCIAEWRGERAIIDWKTSRRQKTKEGILNYFLQATGYTEMFSDIVGEPIDKIVVVIAVDEGPVQIFEESKQTYMNEFLKYVQYYHRNGKALLT